MRWRLLVLILILPLSLMAQSRSKGSVGKGSLVKGVKVPRKGTNFRYFSPFSYYILRRAFVHDKLNKTILQAYKSCEKTCPNVKFRLMETSRKKGGKMWPHRTHQNGLSVDFMTPLKKKGRQWRGLDWIGVSHYLLAFDSQSRLKGKEKVEIDYEIMARHLLALDDAARKNGLKIKKVILKISLQPALFKTPSGKKLKKRGIYFVRALPKMVDNVHDDHYHVDFGFI